ncbi:hypothetical protein [uncultured Ruminococcus sp.]|uniref:hypothetical protein n=1 Tax=Ruminococcus sp. TaxID=41978 RepID=UPI002676CB7C|nr:hypothetical protein [uncultured Ruminococcus sp.]
MQKLSAGFGLILPCLTALSGGALSGGESDLFPWESGQMLRRWGKELMYSIWLSTVST